MIPKILFSLITTVLAELSLILYQYDNPSGFIPLMETLSNHNGIAAYDCFIILSLIYHKFIFSYFGISLSSLRNLFLIFNNSRPMEILAIALTAVFTHFFICPFLLVIFQNPIQEIIHSGNALRKAVILQIPLVWICLITFIQRIPSGGFIGNIQPPRWQP